VIAFFTAEYAEFKKVYRKGREERKGLWESKLAHDRSQILRIEMLWDLQQRIASKLDALHLLRLVNFLDP
jgi:hypothetical protein